MISQGGYREERRDGAYMKCSMNISGRKRRNQWKNSNFVVLYAACRYTIYYIENNSYRFILWAFAWKDSVPVLR